MTPKIILNVSRPFYSPARLWASLVRRQGGINVPPRLKLLFQVKASGNPAPITVRDIDSIRMADPYSPASAEQLALILAARQASSEAKLELERRREEDLAAYARFDPARLDLGDYTDYLVPSTSPAQLPAELIGDKGVNLLKLQALGFPVPDFCVVTTRVQSAGYLKRQAVFEQALLVLEQLTGRKLHDPDNPLIYSLRSCLPVFFPGRMPTYLNLGATAEVMPGLISHYGEATALAIRLDHLKTLLLDYDEQRFKPQLSEMFLAAAHSLTPVEQKVIITRLEQLVATERFLTFIRPEAHLGYFMERIMKYFRDNQSAINALAERPCEYPVLILQAMAIGKHPAESFSGVLYTRDPRDARTPELAVAPRSFGDEIMSGTSPKPVAVRLTTWADIAGFSPALGEVQAEIGGLEMHLGGPVTLEVTQERGTLAVLQANVTSLYGTETLTTAIDLLDQQKIQRQDILRLVKPYHLFQLFADSVNIPENWRPTAVGSRVLPRGRVGGQVYFSEEAALAAKDRGEKVVLAKEAFTPTDVDTIMDMDGLISVSDAAEHVTQIAHRYGIVSLVGINQAGAVPRIEGNRLVFPGEGNIVVQAGDYVVLSSRRQALYLGRAEVIPSRLKIALTIGPGDLIGRNLELWKKFERYRQEINLLGLADISNSESLADLVSILLFLNQNEKARQFANEYFDQQSQAVAEYFLATRIGHHKGRLIVFDLLGPDQVNQLIKLLLLLEVGKSSGTFIVGRLCLSLMDKLGQEGFQSFLTAFSGAEQMIIQQEIAKAQAYLAQAQIFPPPPQATAAAVPGGDDAILLSALERRIGGEAFAALTGEQRTAYLAACYLSPDPLHKTHKTAAMAARQIGLQIR